MSSPPAIDAWNGLCAGVDALIEPATVTMIVERNDRTGSGAFRARLSDQRRAWVKPLNNPQGPRVPVTEFLIANAAALIDAPTCRVDAVKISAELAGEEFRPGLQLEEGFASASIDLGAAAEERSLIHRDEDDNPRRMAGVFAVYYWCWGSDDQWLYASATDNSVYSHDHGLYLPGGPGWTRQTLSDNVDVPHDCPQPDDLVDPAALEQYAARLEVVTRADLRVILRRVKAIWPDHADEPDLEAAGWFLERRSVAVAARLRARAERLTAAS